MSQHSIPSVGRCVEVTGYDGNVESLRVVERAVRKPSRSEVVVRVAAAPINPSDLLFLSGRYGMKRPLPGVPGFEGSGTVVSAGGTAGKLLVGRRVAVAAGGLDGTWAEYAVLPMAQCVPLRKHVDDDQGATFLVNPLTAWVLVDRAKKERHKAIAQTAAASALGRMMITLAAQRGIPLVNIVRRKEQVATLRQLGAEYVIDSSDPSADEQMKTLFKRLGVTLAFDAVAGPMTHRLLSLLPNGSRVTVYGALSPELSTVDAHSLIFERKSIDGYWLADFFTGGIGTDQLRAFAAVTRLFGKSIHTPIRAKFGLDRVREAVQLAGTDMSAGKVMLNP